MATYRKLASGNFQVIIRLKGLKPIVRSFSTKAKARVYACTVEADTELARKLRAPAAEVIDLETAVDLFLALYAGRDPSINGRQTRFKRDLGNRPINQVDPLDVKRVLNDIAVKRTGATASRYKSNLSSLFRWLIHHPNYEGLQLKNPAIDPAVPSYGQMFAAFGVHALLNQDDGDAEDVTEKPGHGIFFTALLLILVAEFGDKTQIAVAGLAGSMAPIPVWVGATIALVMISAVGVWAGRTVLQRLPLHWLHRAGGGIFLVFATMAAWRALA